MKSLILKMTPKKNFLLVFILLTGLALGLSSCAKQKNNDPRYEPVLHNGRVKPFDSFARYTLKLIAGAETWRKASATATLKEYIADKNKIIITQWIRVDYPALKKHLGLPEEKTFFSMRDLGPTREKIQELVMTAQKKRNQDERPSLLEQKAENLWVKLKTLENLISGDLLSRAPEHTGSSKIWLEVQYFRFRPFECAAIAYLLAFVFLGLFRKIKLFTLPGMLAVTTAFLFHTAGLAIRVIVLSRPPVSNMYESMIFMNWALMIFAALFCLTQKNPIALGVGSLMSALVMIYANLLPIDSSLDVLVPVLRSGYWLSVHVMTIVASYGAFGLAVGLGHRHLFCSALNLFSEKDKEVSARLIYRVIQLGVILIGAGTVLGGVWANESWGRFWGWDPKETWALITFLGYLVVVHLKYAKKLSDFGLALSAVVGFLLVLMTWYGVNFVLGRGLHSYGAGSGGMQWVVYFLIFEALFVAWVLVYPWIKGAKHGETGH
jgi:cytochrome c-type biogenesis protein CcsB